MIDHVFSKQDRAVGPSFNCEGELAKVLGVDDLVSMGARGFQLSVSRAYQGDPTFVGRMAQNDAAVFGIAGPRMEHSA